MNLGRDLLTLAHPILGRTETGLLKDSVVAWRDAKASLRATLPKRDSQIAALTAERDRLRIQVDTATAGLTRRIEALEKALAVQ